MPAPSITIPKEERNQLVTRLQTYLREELDCDAGGLETGFLLDFILKEAGAPLYNTALDDARTALESRLETMVDDTLVGLEKPVVSGRR